MKFALFPPRFLGISPSDVLVVEENRLRPSQATVLTVRPLSSLGKLHFKPTSSRLSFVFKEGGVLHVELGSHEEVDECVGQVRGRLESQGVTGTRTSAAKSRALERAHKLLDLAKVRCCASLFDASLFEHMQRELIFLSWK